MSKQNEIKNEVLKIMERVLYAKTLGIDVFVEYAPHVETLTVRVYADGWSIADDTYSKYKYLSKSYDKCPKYTSKLLGGLKEVDHDNEMLLVINHFIEEKENKK